VACLSRTLEHAEGLAAAYAATAYTDLSSLLDQARPDLVVITTPDHAHLEVLEPVLERGLHAFVEKPLQAAHGQERVSWDDYTAAMQVLRHWQRTRSIVGMNFNYRAMPHLRQLKSDVESGALGRVRLVNATAHLNCWSHMLDILRWSFGEVVEVHARTADTDRVVSLGFASGALGTLVGATFNFAHDLIHLEAYGADARGRIDGLNGAYRRRAEQPGQPDLEWPRRDFLNDNFAPSFRASIDAFCQALRTGTQPPVSADDGLAELAIEAAIHRSASTHRPEAVPWMPPAGEQPAPAAPV
jgi:myo-inositol 2-dehydrogenase/D-chiro-inositol 1-dehydrogenase